MLYMILLLYKMWHHHFTNFRQTVCGLWSAVVVLCDTSSLPWAVLSALSMLLGAKWAVLSSLLTTACRCERESATQKKMCLYMWVWDCMCVEYVLADCIYMCVYVRECVWKFKTHTKNNQWLQWSKRLHNSLLPPSFCSQSLCSLQPCACSFFFLSFSLSFGGSGLFLVFSTKDLFEFTCFHKNKCK